MVESLALAENERKAVILAAKHHDQGKKRVIWQRSIGNPNPTSWLAKSGGRMKPIELTEYRHEFGSLLDVLDQRDFLDLSAEQQELVLHLVAAHHGLARPHFPSSLAFDPEPTGKDVSSIAAEIPRRFARLQSKYGRWGLAYLESLLRAADYAASAAPSSTLEDWG
jgi:CRISPR-associated endonuclease/helicase Cas3